MSRHHHDASPWMHDDSSWQFMTIHHDDASWWINESSWRFIMMNHHDPRLVDVIKQHLALLTLSSQPYLHDWHYLVTLFALLTLSSHSIYTICTIWPSSENERLSQKYKSISQKYKSISRKYKSLLAHCSWWNFASSQSTGDLCFLKKVESDL